MYVMCTYLVLVVVPQFCRGRLAVLPLVAAGGGGGDVSSRLTSANQCPVTKCESKHRIHVSHMSGRHEAQEVMWDP